MISNDIELMAAQARVQVIQGILPHSRKTLPPDDFSAQSSGWLREWDRIEADIRAYISSPVSRPTTDLAHAK